MTCSDEFRRLARLLRDEYRDLVPEIPDPRVRAFAELVIASVGGGDASA